MGWEFESKREREEPTAEQLHEIPIDQNDKTRTIFIAARFEDV